jgi:hypothetical protein
MTITSASLETDLRLALCLDAALHVLLHDSATIKNTGAVTYLGSINGSGSDVSQIRFAGLDGTDAMATVTDGAACSATAVSLDSASITVARKCILRQITDLAVMTGMGPGDLNPATLAASVVGEYNKAFMTDLGTAVAAFSTTVGTSGADMTVDDYYDAVFQLELNSVPGPFFCLLAPRQLADFQTGLRAEGGAASSASMTFDMLHIKGEAYAGSFLGVDIWKSSNVTTTGADVEGGMWGVNCIGYKTGDISVPPGAIMTRPERDVVVEFARGPGAASGYTQVLGHAYYGIGILEQARGVGIVTDKP